MFLLFMMIKAVKSPLNKQLRGSANIPGRDYAEDQPASAARM